MVAQQTIQFEGSGSIPTTPQQLKIFSCDFKDIRFIFESYHYKAGHMGGGISHNLCLKFNRRIFGGAVIGKMRHDKIYSVNGKKAVEIRRLALIPECPLFTASYFLSKIVWWLKNNTDIDMVFSYSDLSLGHKGTIYKAAGFDFIKETTPTIHVYWQGKRYHPRSLTIERPYSYRLREAVKNGEAEIKKEKPKLLFSYVVRKQNSHEGEKIKWN